MAYRKRVKTVAMMIMALCSLMSLAATVEGQTDILESMTSKKPLLSPGLKRPGSLRLKKPYYSHEREVALRDRITNLEDRLRASEQQHRQELKQERLNQLHDSREREVALRGTITDLEDRLRASQQQHRQELKQEMQNQLATCQAGLKRETNLRNQALNALQSRSPQWNVSHVVAIIGAAMIGVFGRVVTVFLMRRARPRKGKQSS